MRVLTFKQFVLVALVLRLCAGHFLLAQDESASMNSALAEEGARSLEDIAAAVSDGRPTKSPKTDRLARLSSSSLTIVTRKQIEETGARSIAEVLRLVPGINYRMTPM